jgi:hypothetical protein
MKIENKIKQNKTIKEARELTKEGLKKLAGYGLMIIWVIALVLGLGANSWFLFFVALILSISYLTGMPIRMGCSCCHRNNDSYLNKSWNDYYYYHHRHH